MCNVDNQCIETGTPSPPPVGAAEDTGCGCVVTGSQPKGMAAGGYLLAFACFLLFVRMRKVRYNEPRR